MVFLMRAAQFLVGALSFLVAINLAVLLYARTITRLGEIAVRTALGASRGRILSQFFVEALVLTTLGAAAGLVIARVALRQVEAMAGSSVPFWWTYSLGPSTVLYAFALAVVAALIMGVLPGLKATGSDSPRTSRNCTDARARDSARCTTMIVAQVAVAVAILPAAVFLTWYVLQMEFAGRSAVVDRLVVANMVLSDEAARNEGLVRQRQDALMSPLRGEPGVTAVTFSSALPGLGPDRRIEFQPSTRIRDASDLEVASFRVDVDLLRVYEARLLAGRGFEARDVGAARAAIVNRTFVDDLLALQALSRAHGAAWHAVPLCGGSRRRRAVRLVRDRRCRRRLPAPAARSRLGRGTVGVPPAGVRRRAPRRAVDQVRAPRRLRMRSGACARLTPRSTRRFKCTASCRCRCSMTRRGPLFRRWRWPSSWSRAPCSCSPSAGVARDDGVHHRAAHA